MSKAKNLSDFVNEIPYDNTASGLTAVDVQGAIDEIAAILENVLRTE